jgi:hypothetical protein
MTWHHDRTRLCQATGNKNPGTSFSAIAKKIKIKIFLFAGPAALKHFEYFFLDTSSIVSP